MEDCLPTSVPTPTPQGIFAQESSLHLTPIKCTRPGGDVFKAGNSTFTQHKSDEQKNARQLNSTKTLEKCLTENQHERKLLEQKLAYLDSQLENAIHKTATVPKHETIFTGLPETEVDKSDIISSKKIPKPKVRKDPLLDNLPGLDELEPKPKLTIMLDAPNLSEFVPPTLPGNSHLLFYQLKSLGVLSD